jgi:oxygen-independent coproporphyrinogen-3 oxidase
MSKPIGIYIHVPFCQTKCPYCDFYSLTGQSVSIFDDYTKAVICSLALWSGRLSGARADTLYFGGGTPTLLGGERLAEIIKAAGRHFGIEGAEITIEANPGDSLEPVFSAFAQAGGNRVSIGAQSFNQEQLRVLGRRHNPADARAAIETALSAGIHNISVDIMLCIPTPEPENPDRQIELAVQSVSDAAKLRAKHISAYMLKIEKNTPFSDKKGELFLPSEDTAAEIYLAACLELERQGYRQYEISNFAAPGYICRHNLKYWNLEPYLGIGPAAHSYLDGRRFYYPADLDAFISGCAPEPEGDHITKKITEQEYIMLRLRLAEGVTNQGFLERFSRPIPQKYYRRASRIPSEYLTADSKGIRLNRRGFLLSNTIIARLLDD